MPATVSFALARRRASHGLAAERAEPVCGLRVVGLRHSPSLRIELHVRAAGRPLQALRKQLQRHCRSAISGWQLNGIVSAQTGTPFTVTTSKDISNTGAANYAQVVPGVDPNIAKPSAARWFNTAAFSDTLLPAGSYSYGTASRNSLRADGPVDWDLGVYRRIPFVHETQFELRAEIFNLLNHPTFSAPTANVESGSFGTVTSTVGNPRQTQFALKYLF